MWGSVPNPLTFSAVTPCLLGALFHSNVLLKQLNKLPLLQASGGCIHSRVRAYTTANDHPGGNSGKPSPAVTSKNPSSRHKTPPLAVKRPATTIENRKRSAYTHDGHGTVHDKQDVAVSNRSGCECRHTHTHNMHSLQGEKKLLYTVGCTQPPLEARGLKRQTPSAPVPHAPPAQVQCGTQKEGEHRNDTQRRMSAQTKKSNKQ